VKRLITSKSVFFLLCALFLLNRFWPAWGPSYDNSGMIKWDVYGYYLYLPATFIYDDPGIRDLTWVDTLQRRYDPTATFYQVQDGVDGMKSIKYPCGSAVIWSPFFFAANFLAEPLGYPADGLSPPYSWALVIGGIIYAFIGLWFLRKVLLKFFTDTVASILLVLITLGTNYWSMAASETVMPHANSFALNCILLWLVVRWHEQPTYYRSIAMAATLGIGVLIRPTEIFWILVPILWNISSWKTFVDKIKFLWAHRMHIVIFSFVFVAVLSLQLFYWKYTMGTWVSYGYQEKFAILRPFLAKCFFSFKKGWFIYTPLMIFCFAGFYFVWKRKREIFWALALFVCVHTWVIFSWECWWYAACFSQRGAIDMYAIMTLPLGFLITAVSLKSTWIKLTLGVVIGFCLLLNLFQTWQYNHGIISLERMSAAYYWRIFGKTSIDPADQILLEVDHWPEPEVLPADANLERVQYYMYTFESDSSFTHENIVDSISYRGARSIMVKPQFEYGPSHYVEFYGETNEYQWIRASVWMKMDSVLAPGKEPPMLCVTYSSDERPLKWKSRKLDTLGYECGTWRQVILEVMSPISLYPDDRWQIFVWHPGKTTIYLDDFQIEAFEPKGQRSGH
jgi:hypothetical protein